MLKQVQHDEKGEAGLGCSRLRWTDGLEAAIPPIVILNLVQDPCREGGATRRPARV
jgi:hypothetical protein